MGIEGTRARGDIIFNDGGVDWHQQILRQADAKASAGEWNEKPKKIKFRVTDAGDAVKGAKVKAKWDGNEAVPARPRPTGSAAITFPKMGKNKINATANESGYAPDEVKLKVN